MSENDAIRLDREGKIEAAAAAYEALISSGDFSNTELVNLIVIYWQSTDYGFSLGKGLSSDFMAHAGERLNSFFRRIDKDRFPDASVAFWRRYIAWADYGSELTNQYCYQLLRLNPQYLEPAMYIFSSTNGQECRPEAVKLLAQCAMESTTRSKYIESVLLAVMKLR